MLPTDEDVEPPVDPFAPRGDAAGAPAGAATKARRKAQRAARRADARWSRPRSASRCATGTSTCSCRRSTRLEDYVALLAAVEDAASTASGTPVAIEGYPPPRDPRVKVLNVTPDPGVIEVNIHPAASWDELIATTETLYEEARQSRLATEKFMLDGRHTGTGGGNHVTLGGATPADSPLLRRPDLLQSLITYWQNHPALSYLFSGHVHRPDEPGAARRRGARRPPLRARDRVPAADREARGRRRETTAPWLVDRLLRHLLTDLTGNTHRAEFSIDKLYSPDSADRPPRPARVPRVRDAAALRG